MVLGVVEGVAGVDSTSLSLNIKKHQYLKLLLVFIDMNFVKVSKRLLYVTLQNSFKTVAIKDLVYYQKVLNWFLLFSL